MRMLRDLWRAWRGTKARTAALRANFGQDGRSARQLWQDGRSAQSTFKRTAALANTKDLPKRKFGDPSLSLPHVRKVPLTPGEVHRLPLTRPGHRQVPSECSQSSVTDETSSVNTTPARRPATDRGLTHMAAASFVLASSACLLSNGPSGLLNPSGFLSPKWVRACHLHLVAKPQIDPIDIQIIQRQFASVRELPRVQRSYQDAAKVLEIDDYLEPSFRRLFTHNTWNRYTGNSPLTRLGLLVRNWTRCSVLNSVWPCIAIVTVWSLVVTTLLPASLLARWASGLAATLQLQGAAIGLLLVFRTDNAYRRLEEARLQWGRIIYLSREIVTKAVVSLEYPVVCDVARYLCAFSWSLRDKLRTTKRRDDILELLLVDPSEVAWVSSQRSRPLALLGRVRQVLYREFEAGLLPPTQHYMIDTDVRELDKIVAGCERLFSSPIPPNMARHGMRSLMLWLFALPMMLAGSLPPIAIACCTACTSYIYFGIDELGVQVEQPFQILPLWQLCHLVQFNIEEALASPELPLRVVRKRQTELEADRFDLEQETIEDEPAPAASQPGTSPTILSGLGFDKGFED